jgi:hypothetical protein
LTYTTHRWDGRSKDQKINCPKRYLEAYITFTAKFERITLLLFCLGNNVNKTIMSIKDDYSTYHGVSKIDEVELWESTLSLNQKSYRLGFFQSMEMAAFVSDIENFRANGIKANNLNREYKIVEHSSDYVKVCTSDGIEFVVNVCTDSSEYQSAAPPKQKALHNPSMNIVSSYGDGTPSFPPLYNSWHRDVASYQTVSTAFTYDITFPHQNSLGLNLKPYYVSYSSGGLHKTIGCLLVIDATPFLASIIAPGDLIIRINNISLPLPCDVFDFDAATRAITSAKAPRTIRFLRPYGVTRLISPAEIMLFMSNDGVYDKNSTVLYPSSLAASDFSKTNANPVPSEKGLSESATTSGDAEAKMPDVVQSQTTTGVDSSASVQPTTATTDIQLTASIDKMLSPLAKFQVVLNSTNSTQSLQLVYLDSDVSLIFILTLSIYSIF